MANITRTGSTAMAGDCKVPMLCLHDSITVIGTFLAKLAELILLLLLLLGYFYSAKIAQCSKCALSTVMHLSLIHI